MRGFSLWEELKDCVSVCEGRLCREEIIDIDRKWDLGICDSAGARKWVKSEN